MIIIIGVTDIKLAPKGASVNQKKPESLVLQCIGDNQTQKGERLHQMEKMQFNARFRELYDLSGCTSITQFAKVLGMNRQSVDRYYNNKRLPDAPALAQICEKMNVTADWLLGLSDVKSTSSDIQTCVKTIGLSENAVEKLTQTKPFRDLSGLLPTDYILQNGQYKLTEEGKQKVKSIKPTVSMIVSTLSKLIESDRFNGFILAYRHFLESASKLKESALEPPQYNLNDIETVVLSRDDATRYFMKRVSDEITFICEEEYKKQYDIALKNRIAKDAEMIEESDNEEDEEE